MAKQVGVIRVQRTIGYLEAMPEQQLEFGVGQLPNDGGEFPGTVCLLTGETVLV